MPKKIEVYDYEESAPLRKDESGFVSAYPFQIQVSGIRPERHEDEDISEYEDASPLE